MLRLAKQVKATGGACLNDAEKSDDLCMFVVSEIVSFTEAIERSALGAQISGSIAAIVGAGK